MDIYKSNKKEFLDLVNDEYNLYERYGCAILLNHLSVNLDEVSDITITENDAIDVITKQLDRFRLRKVGINEDKKIIYEYFNSSDLITNEQSIRDGNKVNSIVYGQLAKTYNFLAGSVISSENVKPLFNFIFEQAYLKPKNELQMGHSPFATNVKSPFNGGYTYVESFRMVCNLLSCIAYNKLYYKKVGDDGSMTNHGVYPDIDISNLMLYNKCLSDYLNSNVDMQNMMLSVSQISTDKKKIAIVRPNISYANLNKKISNSYDMKEYDVIIQILSFMRDVEDKSYNDLFETLIGSKFYDISPDSIDIIKLNSRILDLIKNRSYKNINSMIDSMVDYTSTINLSDGQKKQVYKISRDV
jgi:hypothetical protein